MACEETWVELYDKSHGCALLPTAPNLRAIYTKAVQCDTSVMPIGVLGRGKMLLPTPAATPSSILTFVHTPCAVAPNCWHWPNHHMKNKNRLKATLQKQSRTSIFASTCLQNDMRLHWSGRTSRNSIRKPKNRQLNLASFFLSQHLRTAAKSENIIRRVIMPTLLECMHNKHMPLSLKHEDDESETM